MSSRLTPRAPVLAAESFRNDTKGRVDREKAVVFGVKVCGVESANGNRYPQSVLEAAKAKYDGCPVHVDESFHQNPDMIGREPTTSKIGVFQNPVVKADGLYADFAFNPKHAFTETFLWACENRPSDYGFSHVARRTFRMDGSVRVAEAITDVHRVDIVNSPASTAGVFESKTPGASSPMDAKETAGSITSPAELTSFLKQLFDFLPSGTFNDSAKAEVVNALWDYAGGKEEDDDMEAPTDAMSEDKATESLKSKGKLGVWAAGIVAESIKAKRHAAKMAQATALCDADQLPAHLRTTVFMETVCESLTNETRAKALIADRKATGAAAAAGATSAGVTVAEGKHPATTPAGGAAFDLKAVVKAYKAGR